MGWKEEMDNTLNYSSALHLINIAEATMTICLDMLCNVVVSQSPALMAVSGAEAQHTSQPPTQGS